MAIFFARAKIISRGNGQNAVASAAYRSGERLYDRTEEKTHDYSRKSGILESGIATPEGAPEWMKDRERLWTEIEAQETRKDSQLSREFIIAVPDGIRDNAKALTAELVGHLTARGMVVDWSLHQPSREGDDRNYHWHLMTTMRNLESDGFGLKRRDWNRPEYLDQIKAEFCQTFNRELALKGLEPVDWRSYEAQGITDRVAQEHQGPEKTAIARKEARELARLERQIKAKEKELKAYDGIGTDRRTGNELVGDERGTSRASENGRRKEIGIGEHNPSEVFSGIERTIHDIEDRANRGITADQQRAEREREADRKRVEQNERERKENERRIERDRDRGGRSY